MGLPNISLNLVLKQHRKENNMITEDYVSFEVAKLLKDKGFDICCKQYFTSYDALRHAPNCSNFNHSLYQPTEEGEILTSAPTLQMTMKWLREMHNLVIQIELIDFLEHGEVWLYTVIERKTIKQLTGRDEYFIEHSYEEACEAAIKYCLDNLI